MYVTQFIHSLNASASYAGPATFLFSFVFHSELASRPADFSRYLFTKKRKKRRRGKSFLSLGVSGHIGVILMSIRPTILTVASST